MLFNSIPFLLLFLPITLAGFFFLGRWSRRSAALWLAAASLFFYAWWDVRYLALLMISIGGNFALGISIAGRVHAGQGIAAGRRLALAVAANLALLMYYKYANFFMGNLSALTGLDLTLGTIVLPLGISFFTFTQIAFLVDCNQGKVREYDFIHYVLFVTYFPHLIAGPILHHAEMMPQFAEKRIYRPQWDEISVGLVFFTIGLFKKVIIADGISPSVGPVFDAAAHGRVLTWIEASSGALAYTLQLYFDFSGYSDMAVGISRMFGVRLPLNFASPYKSGSMIEFWRRWHMTLSRFLKEYLYIPLGGNRIGSSRRHANLLITMLLGGLWHGAAWTFVLWGAGHGLALAANHGWRSICERRRWTFGKPGQLIGWIVTFLTVVMLWVMFRAGDVATAFAIILAMIGNNGFALPASWANGWVGNGMASMGISFVADAALVAAVPWKWFLWCIPIVLLAPNTEQIAGWIERTLTQQNVVVGLRKQLALVVVASLLGFFCCVSIAKITTVSEFLYFQF